MRCTRCACVAVCLSQRRYDLTSLFVGSEGTLGIVTEATLRLARVPEAAAIAVVSFTSVSAGANAAMAVMQAGIPVCCGGAVARGGRLRRWGGDVRAVMTQIGCCDLLDGAMMRRARSRALALTAASRAPLSRRRAAP